MKIAIKIEIFILNHTHYKLLTFELRKMRLKKKDKFKQEYIT